MPTKISGETRVNTYIVSAQTTSKVANLNNGTYVVVWQSSGQDGSGYGVYGQLYENAGNPLGSEFRVNTNTAGYQVSADVIGFSNHNFMVVWRGANDGSVTSIQGQLFNSSATPIGNEFTVNTFTAGQQDKPAVAALNDDQFIVTWQSNGQEGGDYNIYGQLYDATANPVGNEFLVNTVTSSSQGNPTVTGLTNGNFVIAWRGPTPDDPDSGIFAQIFNNTGVPVGSEFRVNTYTAGVQSNPSIAGLTNGNFVVTWESNLQDGSGYGVYGQLYTGDGVAINNEFRINTYTNSDQRNVKVTRLRNGGFLATWESNLQDGSSIGIFGKLFAADGTAIGDDFQINTFTSGYQLAPSVAELDDGSFIAVWDSLNDDIYQQRFSPLTINNFNSTSYIDVNNNFNPFTISAAANDAATVTLTLNDPTVGQLSAGTAGSVTSTYHNDTGVWQASGNITDINALLAEIRFTPSGELFDNIGVSLQISDNTGAAINQTLDLVPPNYAPQVLRPLTNATEEVGRPINITIPPDTFFDRNDGVDGLTLSARRTNGGPLPTGLNFYPGLRFFNGSIDSSDSWDIRVTARDPFNATAETDFNLRTLPSSSPTSNPPIRFDILIGMIAGGGFLLLCLLTSVCYKKRYDRKAKALTAKESAESTELTQPIKSETSSNAMSPR